MEKPRKKSKSKGKGKGKGTAYEREICKLLSLWWSDNKHDDIFWRTAVSGARATIRRKGHKRTFGQDGDIQATDPIGQPLLDLTTIEIKRGYNVNTIADLFDNSKKAKEQVYEKFLNQSIEQSNSSGTPYWMLIVKRDRRKELVMIPFSFSFALWQAKFNTLKLGFYVAFKTKKFGIIHIFHLKSFLKKVTPTQIKKALVWTRKQKQNLNN